jgi:hypothetical protein
MKKSIGAHTGVREMKKAIDAHGAVMPIRPRGRPPGPRQRSSVTTGKKLLAGVDGRNAWARRLRDLVLIHVEDLGGVGSISAAELSIVRRAATLEVELELLEARFATRGQASSEDLDLYQRAANSLRRLFDGVGLKRREPPQPSLTDYLRAHEEPSETP